MKIQQIVGADLSKKTIDLLCHLTKQHIQIQNSVFGFKLMLKWLKQQKVDLCETMIVMEHTGLYSYCFEDFLHKYEIPFTKVNALAIKRSIGLVRGKSDSIDARRIAGYGYEKKEKLRPAVPVSKDLKRLQMLSSTRELLVKSKASLTSSMKGYQEIGIPATDLIMKSQNHLIKDHQNQIKRLDDEIRLIMENEASLKQNFDLLQSVGGVGKVVATTVIIRTHNFTRFATARKFACYCGTAPFEHTSGTSIKKRSRVSHLADKKMKTLLDLAAKSAIQYDKELKQYYLRRCDEGKSKMSTINIIRNKIIYRMFAVINRQTPFVQNYLQTA